MAKKKQQPCTDNWSIIEIPHFHFSENSCCGLLDYNLIHSCKWLSELQRNTLPPFSKTELTSTPKMKLLATTCHTTVITHTTTLHSCSTINKLPHIQPWTKWMFCKLTDIWRNWMGNWFQTKHQVVWQTVISCRLLRFFWDVTPSMW
jgi:hypothetical protein